jgi:hypothetical protein
MKLNHCHSAECAQIVEALTAKANAYMEMMDANAKELDRLMAERKPLTDEQPAKEPVGDDWTPCMKLPVVVHVRKQRPDEAHVSTREGLTPVKPDDLIMRGVSGEEYPIGRAIFEQTYSLDTTPPARSWVGLTGLEQKELMAMNARDAVFATEAKLKEKNT